MSNSFFRILTAGMVVAGVASCTTPSERMVQGDCSTVYGGEVCTWGKMSGSDVAEFGATIPLSTIENAPLEGEMTFPPVALARIPLPPEVARATGVDHLGVNWEMHGHPPGTFLTPHFDFHFYTASGQEIEAIDCSDTSKPASLPADYVLPDLEIPGMGTLVGVCVPQMGMHAIRAEEVNASELFGASLIVGYYGGQVVFVEPMIARDKLLGRESFQLDVPAVNDAGDSVSWPTGFAAVYDEEAQSYQFVFSVPRTG